MIQFRYKLERVEEIDENNENSGHRGEDEQLLDDLHWFCYLYHYAYHPPSIPICAYIYSSNIIYNPGSGQAELNILSSYKHILYSLTDLTCSPASWSACLSTRKSGSQAAVGNQGIGKPLDLLLLFLMPGLHLHSLFFYLLTFPHSPPAFPDSLYPHQIFTIPSSLPTHSILLDYT